MDEGDLQESDEDEREDEEEEEGRGQGPHGPLQGAADQGPHCGHVDADHRCTRWAVLVVVDWLPGGVWQMGIISGRLGRSDPKDLDLRLWWCSSGTQKAHWNRPAKYPSSCQFNVFQRSDCRFSRLVFIIKVDLLKITFNIHFFIQEFQIKYCPEDSIVLSSTVFFLFHL